MEIGWRRRSKKRFFFWLSSQNAGNNCHTEQSNCQSENISDQLYTRGYWRRPSEDDLADGIEHTEAKEYYELRANPCPRSQETPSQRASVSLAREASHHPRYPIEDKIQFKHEYDTITTDACFFPADEESAHLVAAAEPARVPPAISRDDATVPASNFLHRVASSSYDSI